MTKKWILPLLICFALLGNAQNGAPASPYYSGFNWTLTGSALKDALATKITITHSRFISYSNIWEADKITDMDPADNSKVLLVYGWENGTDTDVTNDRNRDKTNNGAANGQWNREHVFAKALGVPALIETNLGDGGSDAHHIRPADVQRNNTRGNLKFAAGSGNSGAVTGGWYPGDEWKGDVARMIMYMYLRWGTQCLPTYASVGTPVSTDANMTDLLLQWNADDPVSAIEDARNSYHNSSAGFAQGNRNPFIDNPYLATVIWGGPNAQNRWPNVFLSNETWTQPQVVSVFPNPSTDGRCQIAATEGLEQVQVYNLSGQLVYAMSFLQSPTQWTVEGLTPGFYMVKVKTVHVQGTYKYWVK